MSTGKCIVRLKDSHDTEHSVEVYAESLYEAVLRGLSRLEVVGWESNNETMQRVEVEIHQEPTRHIVDVPKLLKWVQEKSTLLYVAFYWEVLPITRSQEGKLKFHSFGNFFSEAGGDKEDLHDAAHGCLEGREVPVIADSGTETSCGAALTIHGDKHRAGRATGDAPTGRVAGIADKDLGGGIPASDEIRRARREDHKTAVAADRMRSRAAWAIRGGASRSDGDRGGRRGAATHRSARRITSVMDKDDTCNAASG
jgi:hypothetical protein